MIPLKALFRTRSTILAIAFIVAALLPGTGRLAAHEQPVRPSQAAAPATSTRTTNPGNAELHGNENATAENDQEKQHKAEVGDAEKKKVGFVGLPIPIANPTLQQGLALVGAALYHIGEDSPASLTGVGAMYTSTTSWGYGILQRIYTSHDRWRITAGAMRYKLKLRFYGIDGNPGANDPYLPFFLDGKAYTAQVLHSLGKHTYLGLGLMYLSNTTTFLAGPDGPGELSRGLSIGQSVSRLTLPFQWDTRDNTFTPKRGSFLNLTATFSDAAIGSDFTFQQYRAGLSHYVHINDRMILALRGTACDTENEAPFYLLCTLGSGDGLRGFPVEVYWSRASAAGVAEWRWNFAGRWGMVAFAGTGATGRGITNLDLGDLVPSYGIGIRFMMAKDYGVNIGLDYGRSNDRDAIYFRVGEAF